MYALFGRDPIDGVPNMSSTNPKETKLLLCYGLLFNIKSVNRYIYTGNKCTTLHYIM